jgi:hypothetical protein
MVCSFHIPQDECETMRRPVSAAACQDRGCDNSSQAARACAAYISAGPAAHLDAHAQNLAQVLARGTGLHQRLDMEIDAGLAALRNGDAQRDIFLFLLAQRCAADRRLRQGAEPIRNLRDQPVHRPDFAAHLGDRCPVAHDMLLHPGMPMPCTPPCGLDLGQIIFRTRNI